MVALVFFATLFAVYSPLILNKANFTGWRETAAVYSMTWEANGSIYELLTMPFRDGDGKSLEAAKLYARLLGGVGAFMTLYLCIRNRLPFADSAYWLFMIPLLFAPVVYPWYLLWSLAMVPLLQRSRGWTVLVWAATSGLSYQLLREPAWRLPAGWALGEYLPVYLALVFELWSMRLGRAEKDCSDEPIDSSLAPRGDFHSITSASRKRIQKQLGTRERTLTPALSRLSGRGRNAHRTCVVNVAIALPSNFRPDRVTFSGTAKAMYTSDGVPSICGTSLTPLSMS